MLIKNDGEIKVNASIGDILNAGEFNGTLTLGLDGVNVSNKTRTILREALVTPQIVLGSWTDPFEHIINYGMEFERPYEKECIDIPKEYKREDRYFGGMSFSGVIHPYNLTWLPADMNAHVTSISTTSSLMGSGLISNYTISLSH